MATKKSFGNAVKGADKLFSINDVDADTLENISADTIVNTSDNILANTGADMISNRIPDISTNTMANISTNSLAIVLDELIPIKEPPGKSYSYHLASDVADAITREAGKRKISKSKLVEIILRQVLIGGVEK